MNGVECGCNSFVAVCNCRILIVGRGDLLTLSWRDLDVTCSVVCNQGSAANAAEIVIVVAASVKAAAFRLSREFKNNIRRKIVKNSLPKKKWMPSRQNI